MKVMFLYFIALAILVQTGFSSVLKTTTITCHPGYTPFEKTRSCYKAYHEPLDAMVADRKCRDDNGTLVVIHSAEENEFINQLSQKQSENGSTEIWLGMIFAGDGWHWEDKSFMDYLNFDGTPIVSKTKFLAVMEVGSGKWKAVDFFESKAYVCKAPMKSEEYSSIVFE